MTVSAKFVLGSDAVARHLDGASQSEVEEAGSAIEVSFETQIELDAYRQGLDDGVGWLDYSEIEGDAEGGAE